VVLTAKNHYMHTRGKRVSFWGNTANK
ncbi:uncharacterized protein METZ01_LOCUS366659, partial [marine metagenome]